jgi:hypothetical protein
MIESKAEEVFRELLLDAEHHHNLRSYTPAWNQQAGLPGINLTLHNNRVPVLKAQRIGRLLVGGQCLNGGDPAEPPDVAEANACPFCADGGAMVVETLRHAIFECYAYNGYRRHVSALLSSRPNDITTLCRGEWSWKELRALINFFGEVAHKRELVNKKKQRMKDEPTNSVLCRLGISFFGGVAGAGAALPSPPLQPNQHFTLPCRRTYWHLERHRGGISMCTLGRHAGLIPPRSPIFSEGWQGRGRLCRCRRCNPTTIHTSV